MSFAPLATQQIARLEARGHGKLPICIAKTQFSLSHDAKLLGRPTGFEFPVREVRLLAGAGLVVPLAGDIMTMPGLGSTPAYRGIELEADGTISGLF